MDALSGQDKMRDWPRTGLRSLAITAALIIVVGAGPATVAFAGLPVPGEDPHPVPTGLAPIPEVGDATDVDTGVAEDEPTGRMDRYHLTATSDAKGTRPDNIAVRVECDGGVSFSITVAVAPIGGKRVPAIRITGPVHDGVGATIKLLDVGPAPRGYHLGAANAFCIAADGTKGPGIREPQAEQCKITKGLTTRCTIKALPPRALSAATGR